MELALAYLLLDFFLEMPHKQCSRKWRRTWRFKGNLLHVKNC